MVKFIIEVGEDYIRANADSDKAKKTSIIHLVRLST